MRNNEHQLTQWLAEVLPVCEESSKLKLNIDSSIVNQLRFETIASTIRPSLLVRENIQLLSKIPSEESIFLPSDPWHIKRAQKRENDFILFIGQVDNICKHVFPTKKCTSIHFLAGDSHNSGKKLTLISFSDEKYVLKFAEPKAYQLLADITSYIHRENGTHMEMPQVIAYDYKECWYIIPFIEANDSQNTLSKREIEKFMHGFGAITALAYALGFVDAHIENVIIWNNRPIIIDPECILYLTEDMPQDDRLLSTGILSHNIHLSALRGGGIPMRSVGQHIDESGVLRYYHPTTGLRSRLITKDFNEIDPAHYKVQVLKGFSDIYTFIETHQTVLKKIVEKYISDGFKVRFLARKTKHYLSVLEMMALPQVDINSHLQSIQEKFSTSGAFLDCPTELINAEWHGNPP